MSDQQRLLVIGVLVSSTLYLASCIAMGYLTGHPLAWKLAIASAGVSYLTYLVQLGTPNPANRLVAILLATFSVIFGAAAGIALL